MVFRSEQNIEVETALPGLNLDGTETNGANLTLRENAGQIELYDETTGTVAAAWNLNPALELASLAHVDSERDLLPEGAQTGLAADALGRHYQGAMTVRTDATLAGGDRPVYLEAATQSSAGDEVVTVHLVDVGAAADVATITISGGATRTRSADISGGFGAEGNDLRVDWEVTTASATAGATFDAVGAKLVVE